LCKFLINDLDYILGNSQEVNITIESVDDFWYDLESVRDNFEFLLQIVDGVIKEKDYENYGFDGNYESIFNDYLEQLYDVADTVITLNNGEKNKLLWVG
jgi:hypothetical protein